MKELPDQEYYSISDIIKRWSKHTGETIDIENVLYFIREGRLKVKTYSHGKYYPVQKDMLVSFDIRYINSSLVDDFGELKLTDLNNPRVKEFEDGAETTLDTKFKDVYVRHSDLAKFENNKSIDKGLDKRRKNSYLNVILALVDLLKMDISKNTHAVRNVKERAELLDLDVREGTIRDILKEARELIYPPE